jgi:hypothetical protein
VYKEILLIEFEKGEEAVAGGYKKGERPCNPEDEAVLLGELFRAAGIRYPHSSVLDREERGDNDRAERSNNTGSVKEGREAAGAAAKFTYERDVSVAEAGLNLGL